jgi:hypothetical protein
MEKIKPKLLNKPMRLPSKLSMKTAGIVNMVNSLANPGKPAINWFEGYPDAKAAVHIVDGESIEENSKRDIVFGGTIDNSQIKDLKIVAYQGNEGGIYVEGAGSRVVVDGAMMSISGDGKGVGGPATGAATKNHADLTLRNVIIDSYGKSRFCTVAEQFSTLRAYDSVFISHGVPYGEVFASVNGLMATPPPALEIGGNCRTHCTMSNSYSYFYNSKLICDGWGALSTETAEGFVYLEANDCDIIVTKQGYGAYADPDCHDYFNRCRFDIDGMASIIAGEGDMTFTDCTVSCASYFSLMHCVMGVPEEVGTLIVKGGTIRTKKEIVKIKSHNAQIEFTGAEIRSDTNVLIHTLWNDDPCATKPSDTPYGVNVILRNMDVTGDLLHEDPERAMWISLNSTTLYGAIINGNLTMDIGSKWTATADSNIQLLSEIDLAQIDAPKGVTIRARGGQKAVYELAGGGRLVVEE